MVVTSILLESFLEIGAANGTALNSPVAEDYNIHRQTSQLVRAGGLCEGGDETVHGGVGGYSDDDGSGGEWEKVVLIRR